MATREKTLASPQPATTKNAANGTAKKTADKLFEGLFVRVKSKEYPPHIIERRKVYTKLIDHFNHINALKRNWPKFIKRVVVSVVFSCLAAFLVGTLVLEHTRHKRVLGLRLPQWVSMVIMLFSVVSVVPFLILTVSNIFMLSQDKTHKYWVYFIRKMKGSVNVVLWSCAVLFGWHVWFRPRLKLVQGDVSKIASQQITRALISLCVGSFLWALKNALYYKLKADLHYEQLFDRICQTIVYLNGYRILEKGKDRETSFLAYDANMLDRFEEVYNADKCSMKAWPIMKNAVKRTWRNLNCLPEEKEETKNGKWCNIWMDVQQMKREDAPIWILERLTMEYLKEVRRLRPENADELINDDQQLLNEAKQMFKNIMRLSKEEEIRHSHQIERGDLEGYNLSKEELDEIFLVKVFEETGKEKGEVNTTSINQVVETQQQQQQLGNTSTQQKVEENTSTQQKVEETTSTQQKVEETTSTQQKVGETTTTQQKTEESTSAQPQQMEITSVENQFKKSDRPIGVDRFLNWAVRAHKNCWSLERTLKSSHIAFVKLNRMLSTFLIAVIVIIWLLISKIVTTAQLAILFAPFVALSFMFENSSKNLFQGLIFTFAVHPFDVGDRVIIEDIQMRVKELNILTSVFYKYDTGAEVIFPNSKLATTKIVNLDITPDQCDSLSFLIDAKKIPLENIIDLELKIKKFVDDDLYYASGTKVVKKRTNKNPDNPDELQMMVYFKYLVSYLPAEKKAERRSLILKQIMRFRNHMEKEDSKKEFLPDYTPYNLEWTINERVGLLQIEKLKSEILQSLDENGHKCLKKIVLTNLEQNKIKMALYLGESEDRKSEESMPDKKEHSNLIKCFNIIEKYSLLRGCGFTSLKVSRGANNLYPAWSESRKASIKSRIQSARMVDFSPVLTTVNEATTPADST